MNISNEINFSQDNVKLLEQITAELKNILITNHFSVYLNQLDDILTAAVSNHYDDFNRAMSVNSLFGGAGALWEIYMPDSAERYKFVNVLCGYIDQLKVMGIKNQRIDQVRELLPECI